jgi:hypothetical protein
MERAEAGIVFPSFAENDELRNYRENIRFFDVREIIDFCKSPVFVPIFLLWLKQEKSRSVVTIIPIGIMHFMV